MTPAPCQEAGEKAPSLALGRFTAEEATGPVPQGRLACSCGGRDAILAGMKTVRTRATWWTLPLLVLLALLVAASPSFAQVPVPQVEPPAPGAVPPPADPSEPEGVTSFAPPPKADVQAAAVGWPRLPIERLAGSDRVGTAVAVSRTGWPAGAPAAVLATGDAFPDALAASTLAGTVHGPLLLTPTGSLHPTVAAELRRLAPETVYVIGRLHDRVQTAVQGLGLPTERIRGANRYDTAFQLAQRAVALGADPSRVIVASGEVFADALAASPLAAARRHPILLAPRQAGRGMLDSQVQALGATASWVVGGTAALPVDAVAGLPGVERLAGRDRAATAAAVASRARALGLSGPPVIASGDTFPDGLTGGVYAGHARNAPLLLTPRAQLPPSLMDWLATHRPGHVTTVGGNAAVGPVAVCQLREGGDRPWRCIEEGLARQGYNTGAVDGRIDGQSVWTVYAFQKVAGLPVDGRFGEAEWAAMLRRPRLVVRRPDLGPDHVEIDLARQLVLLVRGGEVRHALHTSSGKPSTPTVRGTFAVYEKRDYRQANRMYRSIFFYRGYALHGYPEVPLYPASNGCLRLYDGDADFVFPQVRLGEPVAVYS